MVLARWSMVLLAAVLAVPTTALATHMSSYVGYPTEHDDIGRSFEPDFQRTGVLGTPVENCIVSLNLAPQCIADGGLPPPPAGQSNVLAPGCTDDAGRQPSGLCGLWTVGMNNMAGAYVNIIPPKTIGTQGMSGTDAPGRFTPSKGTTIRFLDSQAQAQLTPPAGGSTYLELNAKLTDSGAFAALAGLNPELGSSFIAPLGNALWAWYGYWKDLNGNGVIDHLRALPECSATQCGPNGGVAIDNEFTWIGRCLQFDGTAAPAGQKYCNLEPDTQLPTWIYPGNHHSFCGFGLNVPTVGALACGITPADAPGRQLYWFATDACPGPDCISLLEEDDAAIYGDPIFGTQDSKGVDQRAAFGGIWGMGDRTGDATITGRQWVHGLGWGTWFYDQSLIVTTVTVTGVTHEGPIEDLETDFDLTKLVASDVDKYQSWTPTLEGVLQGQVKPATRSSWVTAREIAAAEDASAEAGKAIPGTRLTWDQCDPFLGIECPAPVSTVGLGNTLARVQDPGWAKEPNAVGDVYPGAVRNACASGFDTFQGQCNTYAGYAAGPRAFLDLQEFAAYYGQLAWSLPGSNCITCVTAPPSALPILPAGYLRDEGDRSRVIQPGSHVFAASAGLGVGIGAGAWTDKAQAHEEQQLDVLASIAALSPIFRGNPYVVGPDGFVGDIVNATGFNRAGGFAPEPCTIRGVTAVYEYAQCHPYGDGNFEYMDGAGGGDEYDAAVKFGGEGPQGHWLLRLRAADGCWSTPTIVWRNFDTWEIGDTASIQDFTGRCEEITADMGEGPGMITRDLFIFPQGGDAMTSEVAGIVTVKEFGVPIVQEFVRDVDDYRAWSG